MKKYIAIVLIFFMTVVSGCIKKKEVNTKVRDYIVYNIEKLPEDLIMLDNHNIRQEELLLCLFEGLVSVDEKGEIVPALASEWETSEDKLSYQFTIRDNAKWSDGSDITADDFVDFFSELLKYQNNIYKQQLYCIFGARDYAENKVDMDSVAVNAVDNKTLEIRLNYPCSYFLDILGQPIYVLRKDFNYLKEWKKNYDRILYSGAFKLESISDKLEPCFLKNKMYWDNKNVISDKLYIKNEEASAFVLADYKWNEVDIMTDPPKSEINEFLKNDEILKNYSLDGMSLYFNLNKQGIVRDDNFRKCINYCISRKDINNISSGEVVKSFVPQNIKGYSFNSSLFTEYSSSSKAEEFLDKSKYNKEKIKLVYCSEKQNNKEIVDEIVKSLKTINLNILSEGYNQEKFKEVIENSEYDVLLTEYIGEYNSPMAFLEKWVSNSRFNIYGYNNIDYDVLILKARITRDNNQAIQYLNSAQELLYNDMPCIPLYFYENIICRKKYIEGLQINKRGNIILKNIYIKKPI
ncbi:peptide ABC transporter substrate-binding protein [Clostridium sp. ZS2-4]|uniref:peptide ABC transporter substrate-binding protein n=1 Tax=Clostridium sp. ZS2-4 TaxID=2987703 RepID=UPI00227C448F|nr:peptide ABC transporter substrate-binding protein [Clostridium sp. ZS2-4]MCY6355806.1 peptide ABC transporter substrate-binding protein [Clostridium sp. ZS2-4]